jgi:hypothetical protein
LAELAALVAVLASTLFAGAAIYINIAEHPARLACGTELAATQFIPSYKRAAVMQVFLAATATLAGLVRGGLGGGMIWFVASGLIFAVIPFTLIAILPTNSRLLDPSRDRSSSETRALLEKWGRLHAVRSAVSLVAAVLFIWAAVRNPVALRSGTREVDVSASRGWQGSGVRVAAGHAVTIAYLSGAVQDQETAIADANGTGRPRHRDHRQPRDVHTEP